MAAHPADGRLIGGACVSLVHKTAPRATVRGRQAHTEGEGYAAAVVMLFAVREEHECKGVGGRLLAFVQRRAVECQAAKLLILSAEPAERHASWWVRRLEPDEGWQVRWTPCVTLPELQAELMGQLGRALPAALWLPWPVALGDGCQGSASAHGGTAAMLVVRSARHTAPAPLQPRAHGLPSRGAGGCKGPRGVTLGHEARAANEGADAAGGGAARQGGRRGLGRPAARRAGLGQRRE